MKRVADELHERQTHPNNHMMSFFDLPPVAELNHAKDEKQNLDMKYARWIDLNAIVLDVFCDYALLAFGSGRRKIGAKAICEDMRWDDRLPTTGDAFKLNNSFTSRLARSAIARHPELAALFELRELRS